MLCHFCCFLLVIYHISYIISYIIGLAQIQGEGTTQGHEYQGSWFMGEHFGRLATASLLKRNRSQSRMLGQVQSHRSVCSIQRLSLFALDHGGSRKMPFSVDASPEGGIWNRDWRFSEISGDRCQETLTLPSLLYGSPNIIWEANQG